MPIHEAAKLDNVKILNLILATKANVNLSNDESRTPLHIASSLGKFISPVVTCNRGGTSPKKSALIAH